jgi:hypothetical protein
MEVANVGMLELFPCVNDILRQVHEIGYVNTMGERVGLRRLISSSSFNHGVVDANEFLQVGGAIILLDWGRLETLQPSWMTQLQA